jgi:hypothetical protein
VTVVVVVEVVLVVVVVVVVATNFRLPTDDSPAAARSSSVTDGQCVAPTQCASAAARVGHGL